MTQLADNHINSKYFKSMKSLFYITLFMLGTISWVSGQDLEEEIGFVYVKAEYLYKTGRYEEAVAEYSKVIQQNPNYKDALMYRGMARMEIGQTDQARQDALKSIEMNGIQAASAALLGRSFGVNRNYDAAVNSLTAAIALDNNNGDYYNWRAVYLEASGKLTQACQDYTQAVAKGNQDALPKVKSLCGGKPVQPNKTDMGGISVNPNKNQSQNPNDIQEGEVLSDGQRETEGDNAQNNEHIEDSDIQGHNPNIPSDDNTVNVFEIDDDLSIEISGQELGLRKITEIPSILILADENGKVTINICVNREGVVTSAEYNSALSTIAKKALVSLAIRKAKDFEFEAGKYDSQCGIMVFKIKSN